MTGEHYSLHVRHHPAIGVLSRERTSSARWCEAGVFRGVLPLVSSGVGYDEDLEGLFFCVVVPHEDEGHVQGEVPEGVCAVLVLLCLLGAPRPYLRGAVAGALEEVGEGDVVYAFHGVPASLEEV